MTHTLPANIIKLSDGRGGPNGAGRDGAAECGAYPSLSCDLLSGRGAFSLPIRRAESIPAVLAGSLPFPPVGSACQAILA